MRLGRLQFLGHVAPRWSLRWPPTRPGRQATGGPPSARTRGSRPRARGRRTPRGSCASTWAVMVRAKISTIGGVIASRSFPTRAPSSQSRGYHPRWGQTVGSLSLANPHTSRPATELHGGMRAPCTPHRRTPARSWGEQATWVAPPGRWSPNFFFRPTSTSGIRLSLGSGGPEPALWPCPSPQDTRVWGAAVLPGGYHP